MHNFQLQCDFGQIVFKTINTKIVRIVIYSTLMTLNPYSYFLECNYNGNRAWFPIFIKCALINSSTFVQRARHPRVKYAECYSQNDGNKRCEREKEREKQ